MLSPILYLNFYYSWTMGLPLANSILPRPQAKFVCSSLGYSKSNRLSVAQKLVKLIKTSAGWLQWNQDFSQQLLMSMLGMFEFFCPRVLQSTQRAIAFWFSRKGLERYPVLSLLNYPIHVSVDYLIFCQRTSMSSNWWQWMEKTA